MELGERCLLPDGVDELMPERAWQVEDLRRRLIDLLRRRGYELVTPPLMEYLQALLTGVGEDLDLQTFKLIDQLSGRLLGVRADHTPQVARLDTHYLKTAGPTRLCYVGPALRTRPHQFGGPRELLQIGAELFGFPGLAADCEVLETMVALLDSGGASEIHLDLGHVGLFRALARDANLTDGEQASLFDAVRRKSRPDVADACAGLSSRDTRCFQELLALNGDMSVLTKARRVLGDQTDTVADALDDVAEVAHFVRESLPDIPLYIDLAELRGYRYHTGVVFSAFVPNQGQAVAQGGRYDDIGGSFGCGRAATGFSADVRQLTQLDTQCQQLRASAIAAPRLDDAALKQEIERLRSAGERVVHLLPGQVMTDLSGICDRQLTKQSGHWVTNNLEDE